MTAVGELVLVLGLLVSAHCEVRARDPEVEEEEGGRATAGGEGLGLEEFRAAPLSPDLEKMPPRVTQTPPPGERGTLRDRTGNWCAFEQKRVVTMAEKDIIKSRIQMVRFPLSSRPVHTQKLRTVPVLQWRCCPGYGGKNCEDTDEHQRDQNDSQASDDSSYNQHKTTPTTQTSGRAPKQAPLPATDEVDATFLNYPEAPAALPIPHMMVLVMSQLQPILQGFNRSLEHLSRQVGDLARDVVQLKSTQQGPVLQVGPLEGHELDEAAEERLEARLDEVFQKIREVQGQVESQQTDMDKRLHSQHAMLHNNLATFKMDFDMKLQSHHKMLQAGNSTLSELKLDQDQTTETPPLPLPQPSESSALWEAIKRLDNMVVNNTVKVDGLAEDMEVTLGSVQQLRRDWKEMERQINQTARNSQILFMEMGLEVEEAKVVVLGRVEELVRNLTHDHKQLQDMEVDVDYLYTALYHNHSTASCVCTGLMAAIARLEGGVANVTALANKNRLDLDECNEGAKQWGETSDWQPVVEALQRSLQQVEASMASEQIRIRTLEQSLVQFSSPSQKHLLSSFHSLLEDVMQNSDVLELLLGEEVLEFLAWPVQDQKASSVPALKEQLRHLKEQVRGHNLSIALLLSNKPGHGEEVPSTDQPPPTNFPPDYWFPGGVGRSSGAEPARERQLLLPLDHRGDGSDLSNLEKQVEQLELKLLQVEEKPRPCTCPNASSEGGVDTKLQAEVRWLKKGLEEHLRMFKNVFSNTDMLAGSDATLELDKLWQLLTSKGEKKEKKRGRRREGSGRGAKHGSRRESSGVYVPFSQSENSVLFVARAPLSVSDGVVVFQTSLNQAHFYSDTGVFTAPQDGVYLFILTLDLRPGPSHVVLRRGSGTGEALMSPHRQAVKKAGTATDVSLLLLKEGEELRLELRGGVWAESGDNVFIGLLLHPTT